MDSRNQRRYELVLASAPCGLIAVWSVAVVVVCFFDVVVVVVIAGVVWVASVLVVFVVPKLVCRPY